MLDNNVLVKVKSRTLGTVGYTIPDMGNLHRSFQPKEVKEIPMEELRKLYFSTPGGDVILRDCLVVNNEEAVKELFGEVQPEYYYSEEDIKTLLNIGTIEQVMDCLEYAPAGVLELVKNLAVELEVSDLRKRDAIKNTLGFDVSAAIEIKKASTEGASQVDANAAPQQRRAAPITKDKYNVVSIEK